MDDKLIKDLKEYFDKNPEITSYIDAMNARRGMIVAAQSRTPEENEALKERFKKILDVRNFTGYTPGKFFPTATEICEMNRKKMMEHVRKWKIFMGNTGDTIPYLFSITMKYQRPVYGIVMAMDEYCAEDLVKKKWLEVRNKLRAMGQDIEMDLRDIQISVARAEFEDPFIWMGQFPG